MAHISKTELTVVINPIRLSHTMSGPSSEQQTLLPLIKMYIIDSYQYKNFTKDA